MKRKFLINCLIYLLPLSLLSACGKKDVSNEELSSSFETSSEENVVSSNDSVVEDSSSVKEPLLHTYDLNLHLFVDYVSQITTYGVDGSTNEDFNVHQINTDVNGKIEYTKEDAISVNLDNTQLNVDFTYATDDVPSNTENPTDKTRIVAKLDNKDFSLNDNNLPLDEDILNSIQDFLEMYIGNQITSNGLNLTNMVPISAALTKLNSYLNEGADISSITGLVKSIPQLGQYISEEQLTELLETTKDTYDYLPFIIVVKSSVLSGINLKINFDYAEFVEFLYQDEAFDDVVKSRLPDDLRLNMNFSISSLGHLKGATISFATRGKLDNPDEETKKLTYSIAFNLAFEKL